MMSWSLTVEPNVRHRQWPRPCSARRSEEAWWHSSACGELWRAPRWPHKILEDSFSFFIFDCGPLSLGVGACASFLPRRHINLTCAACFTMLGVVSGVGQEILPGLYTKRVLYPSGMRKGCSETEPRMPCMDPYKKRNQARGTEPPAPPEPEPGIPL